MNKRTPCASCGGDTNIDMLAGVDDGDQTSTLLRQAAEFLDDSGFGGPLAGKLRAKAERIECAPLAIPSTALLDALVGIANTAQACPDRCMVDVCNDNFLTRDMPLRAEMGELGEIRIETSNAGSEGLT